MTQINDAILLATGGPSIDDGLLSHYQAGGATSNNIIDAETQFLIVQGAVPSGVAGMWRELLIAGGFDTDGIHLDDMKFLFWDGGGTFPPPPP